MQYLILLVLVLVVSPAIHTQSPVDYDSLPYRMIEAYPENSNSAAIIQRLVDGLGYRYYWASEGLKTQDLEYKASESNRSSYENLQHIFELSHAILQFAENKEMSRVKAKPDEHWENIRAETLFNLKAASDILARMDDDTLYSFSVRFSRGNKTAEFEMWHIINGQISDAIYHVGQLVYNRRASGNPLNPLVSVFMGANRF